MMVGDEFDQAKFNLAIGGLIDDEYSFRCNNCRYGRKYGKSTFGMFTVAANHARRTGHTVALRNCGVAFKHVRPEGEYTESLDSEYSENVERSSVSGVDSPPF